jgi:hypothetical protein
MCLSFARHVTARSALEEAAFRSPRRSFNTPDGVSDVTRIDPDNWGHDQPPLDRPGNRDVQLDLFLDYGTNVPLYPKFQAFFRERQPPALIIWGKNDTIFPADGAYLYKRDPPKVEFHLLDTGYFEQERSRP